MERTVKASIYRRRFPTQINSNNRLTSTSFHRDWNVANAACGVDSISKRRTCNVAYVAFAGIFRVRGVCFSMTALKMANSGVASVHNLRFYLRSYEMNTEWHCVTCLQRNWRDIMSSSYVPFFQIFRHSMAYWSTHENNYLYSRISPVLQWKEANTYNTYKYCLSFWHLALCNGNSCKVSYNNF